MSVYIIGEIGSNFDNDFNQALKLIDIAADAGVDAVKFQLFKASVLYPDGPLHVYEAVSKAELPREWVPDLKDYAENKGLDFLASPFDLEAIDVLEKSGVMAYKIASSELINQRLLIKVARTNKPVYLSTGMSSLADIAEAVEVLDSNGAGEVTLLHCSSVYPTPYAEANLGVMKTLKNAFHKKVGFSDHTLGISIPTAAVALGATTIEKHFTISNSLPGPDHSYALEPDLLKNMVEAIRQVELSIQGVKTKNLLPDEKKWGRLLGLYAANDMSRGHLLTAEDIVRKRPAISIPARYEKLVISQKIGKKINKGDPIFWTDLEN